MGEIPNPKEEDGITRLVQIDGEVQLLREGSNPRKTKTRNRHYIRIREALSAQKRERFSNGPHGGRPSRDS